MCLIYIYEEHHIDPEWLDECGGYSALLDTERTGLPPGVNIKFSLPQVTDDDWGLDVILL